MVPKGTGSASARKTMDLGADRGGEPGNLRWLRDDPVPSASVEGLQSPHWPLLTVPAHALALSQN